MMQRDIFCIQVNRSILVKLSIHSFLSSELSISIPIGVGQLSIRIPIGVGHVPHPYFLLCHSNVAAGRLFGIPLRGTHSHAFVSSFMVGNYDTFLT